MGRAIVANINKNLPKFSLIINPNEYVLFISLNQNRELLQNIIR